MMRPVCADCEWRGEPTLVHADAVAAARGHQVAEHFTLVVPHPGTRIEPTDQDAAPLGSGHTRSGVGQDTHASGGSAEDLSTHLIRGAASTTRSSGQE